ncbi:MAG: hypothetical protein LJF04_10920, partial [Gemmatimonadetes bacterium]|nr:hypothetical protein [Gemmatimonadota bacterium]
MSGRFAPAAACRGVCAAVLAAAVAAAAAAGPTRAQAQRFEVTVSPSAHQGPLTGRLVVVLAKEAEPEPRLRISPSGPALFGVDLESLPLGGIVVMGEEATAYPQPLSALPPGDYYAQAVVNVYEEVRRADGHVVWLHMNDGTVEFFTVAAGNLFSDPVPVHVGSGGTVRIEVGHVIPPPPRPADTPWLRHVRIRSEMLSRFWGRPVYINAHVLLPKGYEEDPERRYPTLYTLGHGTTPFGFTPDSTRVRGIGEINPATGLETGYDFYKTWVADDFPRLVVITLEQATPYFPDSYSVNSANNGPYGDAMVEEVIPWLEDHFRLLREPAARILEGASTSGWQSLALQLRNPDFFGGAWVLQPDPIDFRSYQLVDVYGDANAFSVPAGTLNAQRPFRRTTEGQVVWTVRDLSAFEDVLGSNGRSGYQLEAWEAVYGPVGDDGYP